MNIFKKIWRYFFPDKKKPVVSSQAEKSHQEISVAKVKKKAKHLPSFPRRAHSRTHIGEKWIAVKRTIGWQYKDDMPEALRYEYSVKRGYRTYAQGAFTVIAKNIKRANQAFARIPHI